MADISELALIIFLVLSLANFSFIIQNFFKHASQTAAEPGSVNGNRSMAPSSIQDGVSLMVNKRHLLSGERELEKAQREGLNVWIVSHGGVGSKNLADYFERAGFTTKTQAWHSNLCHYPYPIEQAPNRLNKVKLALYVYGDPILSICSMKKQQNAELNLLKFNNYVPQPYSDKALLRAMYNQFKLWTGKSSSSYPIVHLHYKDTFNSECMKNIRTLLGTNNFPPRYFKPRVSQKEKCLQKLELDAESLKLAEEMIYHRSDCKSIAGLTPYAAVPERKSGAGAGTGVVAGHSSSFFTPQRSAPAKLSEPSPKKNLNLNAGKVRKYIKYSGSRVK